MIGTAIQEESRVVVYDEKFRPLFTLHGELIGFTSQTVTIKDGHSVAVYDEKCRLVFGRTV